MRLQFPSQEHAIHHVTLFKTQIGATTQSSPSKQPTHVFSNTGL